MKTHPHAHHKPNMAIGGSLVISVAALSYGFGDCAFDETKAEACVAHASGLIDKINALGMHLLQWVVAIFEAAF